MYKITHGIHLQNVQIIIINNKEQKIKIRHNCHMLLGSQKGEICIPYFFAYLYISQLLQFWLSRDNLHQLCQ